MKRYIVKSIKNYKKELIIFTYFLQSTRKKAAWLHWRLTPSFQNCYWWTRTWEYIKNFQNMGFTEHVLHLSSFSKWGRQTIIHNCRMSSLTCEMKAAILRWNKLYKVGINGKINWYKLSTLILKPRAR